MKTTWRTASGRSISRSIVPADLPSGIYAARLEAGDTVDHVPFYVRPAAGATAADILFLGPTNTYLAYGNEKLFSLIDSDPDMIKKMTAHVVELDARDEYLRSRPEIGASCYDLHADGSGTMYSTRLRPVLTMRPDFVTWMTGELRHFSADLYLIEWMTDAGLHATTSPPMKTCIWKAWPRSRRTKWSSPAGTPSTGPRTCSTRWKRISRAAAG